MTARRPRLYDDPPGTRIAPGAAGYEIVTSPNGRVWVRKALSPAAEWTMQRIADALGVAKGTISKDLANVSAGNIQEVKGKRAGRKPRKAREPAVLSAAERVRTGEQKRDDAAFRPTPELLAFIGAVAQ